MAIDLVCDPTTLTLGRLETFARDAAARHAVFSPIVFVANGSYVRHGGKENQAVCTVGATSEAGRFVHPACWTRERRGADGASFKEVVLPDRIACTQPRAATAGQAPEYVIAASVVGTTAGATIERAARLNQLGLGDSQRVCTVLVRNHRAGVRSFCRNDFHFYFGDLDIIQAYQALARQEGLGCDLARSEQPLSYEPYALLVSSTSSEYRREVHRRPLRDILGRDRREPLRRLFPGLRQVERARPALQHQQHPGAALTAATRGGRGRRRRGRSRR